MTKTATAAATATETSDPIERFASLRLEQLYESPLNPRKTFDATEDARLTASVREKGIIEPLVVRAATGDRFEVICGARRKRAAAAAGLLQVPAIVREYSDAQALEIMAIENGQRAHVPPLEEAEGYRRLLLIEKTYTAAMIATKIGHDERYVWNRLRLLQLLPEAQLLLKSGLIGVEHAEVLAKLKESDQKRAISRQTGGLFALDTALEFDDRPRLGSTAYDRVKPVSVRELKQWVATHVRLDIAFAATSAPLDFGETAERVAAAEANDRGKTPIPIVFSHMCPSGASDAKERTYGASAWKRAQGKEGEATCDHARLGFVVAGEHYGESFFVCINRDKCLVHWKTSVLARQKKAAKAPTKSPSQKTLGAEVRQREKDEAERRDRAVWEKIENLLLKDVVAQAISIKTLTPAMGKAILDLDVFDYQAKTAVEQLGATWVKNPAAAIVVGAVSCQYTDDFDDFIKSIAKPFGLDVARLEAIRDKHTPKAETPAPKKAAKK